MTVNESDSFMDYITFWNVILFLNAVGGLILVEWSFYKFRRFRNPNKDLDKIYPAYARLDVEKWQKWRLYPGAMTILLPRVIIASLVMVSLLIWLNLLMIGHTKGNPITGCRKRGLTLVYKAHVHVQSAVALFALIQYEHLSPSRVNYYEEYLGDVDEQRRWQRSTEIDSRVPKRGPGKPSVIVSNHTGFLDIYAHICSPIHPGFTPRVETREVPVLNKLTEGLQSLYIQRGGTAEERNQIVETIIERQRMIEDRCIEYAPFAVFAEATTTNGKVLFPFKRGAFQGMRTVIPSYLSYEHGMVSPHYDTVEFLPLVFILCSSFQFNRIKLHIMPEFTPNPTMLEKHADKGKQPWEIYAWCVRDAIAKQSGLSKENNNNLKDKFAYIDFMQGHKDYMEVDGRMFRIGGTYDSKTFQRIN